MTIRPNSNSYSNSGVASSCMQINFNSVVWGRSIKYKSGLGFCGTNILLFFQLFLLYNNLANKKLSTLNIYRLPNYIHFIYL